MTPHSPHNSPLFWWITTVLRVNNEKEGGRKLEAFFFFFSCPGCYERLLRRGKLRSVKRGKLLCHLLAGITLLANEGHSCVPAGASRRSPQDWNSSEIIPAPPQPPTSPPSGFSKNRGICAISPPGVSFTCPRAKNLLVPIEVQNNFPPSSLVKGDLRQYKHCLKCYWHWRGRGRGLLQGHRDAYSTGFNLWKVWAYPPLLPMHIYIDGGW